MTIRARLKRKEWQSWFSNVLGSQCIPAEALNEVLLQWARGTREKGTIGLSFEATLPDLSAVVEFLVKLLNRMQLGMVVAIVGDSDMPQVFVLPASHYREMIEKISEQADTISLNPLSGTGDIGFDVTALESGNGYEVLVVGAGDMEKIIDYAKELIPAGVVFRGN